MRKKMAPGYQRRDNSTSSSSADLNECRWKIAGENVIALGIEQVQIFFFCKQHSGTAICLATTLC